MKIEYREGHDLESAIEGFKGLLEGASIPEEYLGEGICFHNYWIKNDSLREIFKLWPKYSGRQTYPIPGVGFTNWMGITEEYHPEKAAFNRVEDSDFWNKDHPYGALRLELVQFIIDTLEAEELGDEY